MSGRWYSLTIHSTQLDSLKKALSLQYADSDTAATAKALLRQLQRHIKNEQTITEWERDLADE
jgi:hypothetical protein